MICKEEGTSPNDFTSPRAGKSGPTPATHTGHPHPTMAVSASAAASGERALVAGPSRVRPHAGKGVCI